MRWAAGVDNEACLGWLDVALQEAFGQRKPELWVYLEAVMDEGVFRDRGRTLRPDSDS
jgi:hypothetical protein